MIFVTVGTHEQPFNRLVKAVDDLKADGQIPADESVFIQTGFSTYEPKHCEWSKLLSYEEMQRYVRDARIVITHGGPSSFLAPLQLGKIPLVMPRSVKFGEHVNDHQVEFVNDVAERMGNIIVVHDQHDLAEAIKDYNQICACKAGNKPENNNQTFCSQFERIVDQLISERNA